MKTEKNTITAAEALKKTKEAIVRIDRQKKELTQELQKAEAELAAAKTGTAIAGFTLEEVLADNANETEVKLRNKINKIKAALGMPYYADAEYRKYSIIYLEAIVNEHLNERSEFNEKFATLEYELNTIKNQIAQKDKERGVILDTFYNKTREIGLAQEFGGAWIYGAAFLFNNYKELCEHYAN